MNDNPIAGTSTSAHAVPAVIGRVVEIRDGNHNGTSVWRGADDRLPFCFASHDKGETSYAERCLLVRGLDVDAIPHDHPYGCDLSVPGGLVLLGVDRDEQPEDLAWFEGEILWDSALPVQPPTLTTPTIHYNGTPRQHLLEQATVTMQALREAVAALQGMSPNGRDYYPQGPAAFEQAMKEQRERELALVAVHDEIEAWCERVAEAPGPR